MHRVQHHGRLPAKYLRLSRPPASKRCKAVPRYAELLSSRLWYQPPHLLQVERRSGVGRRGRRTRIGCSDTTCHTRGEGLWSCGRYAGNAEGRVRTTDSGQHPGLRPARVHSPCFCYQVQRGVQAASPLVYRCCTSPPSAWISTRRSLTRPRGRTFTINCSAGTVAPPVKDPQRVHSSASAVCARPMSMAYASPICRPSEPQRRVALCNHGREDFPFYLREPAWALRLDFARRPISGSRSHTVVQPPATSFTCLADEVEDARTFRCATKAPLCLSVTSWFIPTSIVYWTCQISICLRHLTQSIAREMNISRRVVDGHVRSCPPLCQIPYRALCSVEVDAHLTGNVSLEFSLVAHHGVRWSRSWISPLLLVLPVACPDDEWLGDEFNLESCQNPRALPSTVQEQVRARLISEGTAWLTHGNP